MSFPKGSGHGAAPRSSSHHRPHSAPAITSRNHARLRQIRELQHRSGRDASGQFLAEGVRFLIQASERGQDPQLLVVAPDLLSSPVGRRVVGQLRRRGVPVLEVTPEVLHGLALNDEPQGVIGVYPQRWEALETALTPSKPSSGALWLVLETVHSTGNLGSLLRTAEAVGATGAILLGNGQAETPEPYHPTCVRATMGALLGLRFVRTELPAFREWSERERVLVVGTSPSAEVDYQEVAYRSPVALMIGDERKGLTPAALAACTLTVQLPMVGRGDSLNLAVAGSVLLYEVFNQQRRATRKRRAG